MMIIFKKGQGALAMPKESNKEPKRELKSSSKVTCMRKCWDTAENALFWPTSVTCIVTNISKCLGYMGDTT